MPNSLRVFMPAFSKILPRSTTAGSSFSPSRSQTAAIGAGAGPGPATDRAALRQATADSIRALQLIRAYRVRGHLEADLDPLRLDQRGPYPELDYRSYGFGEADLD